LIFLLSRCLTFPLLIYGPSFMWTPHLQLEGVYYEMCYLIKNIIITLYRVIMCSMIYNIICMLYKVIICSMVYIIICMLSHTHTKYSLLFFTQHLFFLIIHLVHKISLLNHYGHSIVKIDKFIKNIEIPREENGMWSFIN
jgi:hypothetical protein